MNSKIISTLMGAAALTIASAATLDYYAQDESLRVTPRCVRLYGDLSTLDTEIGIYSDAARDEDISPHERVGYFEHARKKNIERDHLFKKIRRAGCVER